MIGNIPFRPIDDVIWNLFLAVIPVMIAFFVAAGIHRDIESQRKRWWLWTPLLVMWFVFLPNTCYLLTEWRHYFDTITRSGLYYETRYDHDEKIRFLILTGLYIGYSACGMLAFFLSIWPLDRLARPRYSVPILLFKLIGFPLCALGVYLGLIHRYNSWNIVHRGILLNIIADAVQAMTRPFTAILILGFALILWLLYAAFDIWMDGLAWRRRERKTGEQIPI